MHGIFTYHLYTIKISYCTCRYTYHTCILCVFNMLTNFDGIWVMYLSEIWSLGIWLGGRYSRQWEVSVPKTDWYKRKPHCKRLEYCGWRTDLAPFKVIGNVFLFQKLCKLLVLLFGYFLYSECTVLRHPSTMFMISESLIFRCLKKRFIFLTFSLGWRVAGGGLNPKPAHHIISNHWGYWDLWVRSTCSSSWSGGVEMMVCCTWNTVWCWRRQPWCSIPTWN